MHNSTEIASRGRRQCELPSTVGEQSQITIFELQSCFVALLSVKAFYSHILSTQVFVHIIALRKDLVDCPTFHSKSLKKQKHDNFLPCSCYSMRMV